MRLKSNKWRFSDKPTAFLSAVRAKHSPEIQLPTEPVSAEEEHEFISAKSAAKWLGIPLRSLNQYVQQGLLPSYKLGRHRLFRKKQLINALGAGRLAERSAILR
jgi:excisionase family DNA binding protein